MAIRVYGTMDCPGTINALKVLKQAKIDYSYIDINASMANMKEFLNMRDANADVFSGVLVNGSIGFPVFVTETGAVYLDLGKAMAAVDTRDTRWRQKAEM